MAERTCWNCGSGVSVRGRLKRGLCGRCYSRWRKHGDPNVVQTGGREPGDPAERFWSKVERHGPDECWPWTCRTDADGYGVFILSKRNVRAHRFAYELLVGPLSSDLTIDHTCHDPRECSLGDDCPHRRCVNPAHLEAVPMAVNVMRGSGVGAINAAKTHCIHGHEFTAENTYIHPQRGTRDCRRCRAATDARRRGRG